MPEDPAESGLPDIQRLGDLETPWSIRVAVTLRLAEHLESGPLPVARLAELSGAEAGALERVLRHLVGHGLFDEPEPGTFGATPGTSALTHPAARIFLDLNGFGGRMAHVWNSMLSAVRTGRPAYAEVFGRPFWDDLHEHPDLAAAFDDAMGVAGHGVPDPEILADRDWSAVRSVVDVGGGTGSMLAEILRARPEVRGTLVDLPGTVARAEQAFVTAGVRDRVTLAGQSFFDPLPAGSDVYLVKNVLADWPDAEAATLLGRCAEAARPDGRVVVLGGISPGEEPVRPELLMLVLVGGKDRSLAEFTALAGGAGLRVSRTGRQPTGKYVVECAPA